MDWKIICSQWEKMIDSILYPGMGTMESVDLSKLKYELEEM
jgi:hypothetical protein